MGSAVPKSTAERGFQPSANARGALNCHAHALTVLSLEAMSYPGPDFAMAAIAAVRRWTYKRFLVNGEPVAVQTTVVVNFVSP